MVLIFVYFCNSIKYIRNQANTVTYLNLYCHTQYLFWYDFCMFRFLKFLWLQLIQIIQFQHLGDTTQVLNQLVDGSHPFSKTLAAAKKPLIVLGAQQLSRPDGAAVLAQAQKLAQALSSKSLVKK